MHSENPFIVLAILIAGALFSSANAQENQASLTQNFQTQHEMGHHFRIDPADLPAPKTGPIVTNRSLIVPYSGQVPEVPPGFTATPFAIGLVNPRRLLVCLTATFSSPSRALAT